MQFLALLRNRVALLLHNRVVIVLLIFAWLCLGAAYGEVYGFMLAAGRLVIVYYAARVGVGALGGQTRGLLPFLAGVGGALYILSLLPDLFGHPIRINHRDFPLLVRVVGGAFLVLPLSLARLPVRTRARLGLRDMDPVSA